MTTKVVQVLSTTTSRRIEGLLDGKPFEIVRSPRGGASVTGTLEVVVELDGLLVRKIEALLD